MAEILPEIEARLAAGFSVELCPQGSSMQPMLYGGRDRVVLSPVLERPTINDVILYRRSNGQFVLHRIVGERKRAFVCRGDNQLANEWPVEASTIIAIVTAFQRNGVWQQTTDERYRRYCALLPFRYMLRRIWHTLSGLLVNQEE